MKQTVIVMCGLPACGKSTLAEKISNIFLQANIEDGVAIVSSDRIRKQLYGNEEKQGNPKEVFAKVYNKVADTLALGYKRVIVDSTAVTKKDRKKIIDNLSNLNVDFVCVYFPVDIDKSIKQNKMRARHVPEDVIYRMADKFQAPTIEEGFRAVFLVKE